MSIRKIKRRTMRMMGSTSQLRLTFGADMAKFLVSLSRSEITAMVDAAITKAMRG